LAKYGYIGRKRRKPESQKARKPENQRNRTSGFPVFWLSGFLVFIRSYMDLAEAKSIIESVIFAADEPVSVEQLTRLLDEFDNETILQLVQELQQEYDTSRHGFQMVEVANGFRIYTRSEYASWIRKFYTTEISSRLSISALETLAIIAYKQPATRAEIEEIRGVNSDSVIRTLLERNLIKITGRKQTPGKPMIYETTNEFLIHFGLRELSELPSIDEIEKILGTPKEEMRPEVRKIFG
jgi:segregation and condensation protein B